MSIPATLRRRRPGRRTRGIVALGLAGALVTACGGGGGGDSAADAAGSSGSGELQDVTFLNILPLETLSFAPELVADACGYFADHGLKVTFQTTQGSAQAIQTVIAGSALITLLKNWLQ